MKTNYKSSDVRNSFAAIVCTVLFGSVALLGAVGPAGAFTPVAHVAQLVA